ncbi:MAG: branched-chain amino acid transport system permease protein [Pseudonocardiales bacterium]|nr:branched-chain amino acid transport system permease protein [Pseudonocardiales bacterium]
MNITLPSWTRRLLWCLFGGVVLALMWGKQEGTISGDFGVAFRHALSVPRIFVFLGIGFVLFLLISFRPLVVPYLHRPGVVAIISGLVTVIIAQTVMNWFDPLVATKNSAKFSAVRSAVGGSSASWTTSAFFSWLAWTLAIGAVVAFGAAVATKLKALGFVTAALGVAGAALAYSAHSDVVDLGRSLGHDHSLGVYVDIIGFLTLAGAGITMVYSHTDVADPRAFLLRVMDYRPGLPIAVVGVILGLFAFISDCWFAPENEDTNFSKTHSLFSGSGISSIGSQYLSWLGWTLFAAGAVLALLTTYLGNRILGWVTVVVSVAGIALTFFTLRTMTNVAAAAVPADGAPWKNLGVGGFVACIVFALFGASTIQVLASRRPAGAGKPWAQNMSATAMIDSIRSSSRTKTFIAVGLALAIFYPPMLPLTWQTTLVTQIGVYVLLAVGLNVVVGWAGLLDLGYIAFYAIGSYTTAYLVGALPKKPPHWLHWFHSPLATTPFAIGACLIAGFILGAPTLRLRGDYLAIVTLGFGEIITVIATNAQGFTGGPQGPTVPHPVLKIGGLHITWGQDNLPYWYLLLVMLVVVVVLFYRLEGSRLGRAWAAIREDEVAAQASGVNTTRVKLLAFAIGASTSGFAGVFFATQVGYFDPTLFTLQASILIVAYVVFGGMGSLAGAMAGAAVLTWLPQFLKDQVPANDRQMWIGAAVLAMMIFRPAGLLPARRRKAELEGLDSTLSSEVSAVPASEGL